jgi:hypothetical protein
MKHTKNTIRPKKAISQMNEFKLKKDSITRGCAQWANPARGTDPAPINQVEKRGCFPIESLPSSIRDYALELADVYKVPVELPVLCMIGVLSGAIGKSRQVTKVVPGRTTMANLYIALSLNSGAGKSISKHIAKPITRVEAEQVATFKRHEIPRLKSRQIKLEAELKRIKKSAQVESSNEVRLQEIVRELDEVKRAQRKSVRLIVGNGTTTGLGDELSRVEDETLWVYADSGGHVVDVMLDATKKHSSHIELWLTGFSGESYNQTRSKTSAGGANCVRLENVCLSALLMIPPIVTQRLLNHNQARERGLLSRFLIAEIETNPSRENGIATAVSFSLEEAWNKLVENILQCRQTPAAFRNLECSPEAREVFRDFHNDTTWAWSVGPLAHMRKEISRFRENAIKIAIVLQAATDPASNKITVELARDAATLMRWLGVGFIETLEANRREQLDKRADRLSVVLKKGVESAFFQH